jgi:hypothetical protein
MSVAVAKMKVDMSTSSPAKASSTSSSLQKKKASSGNNSDFTPSSSSYKGKKNSSSAGKPKHDPHGDIQTPKTEASSPASPDGDFEVDDTGNDSEHSNNAASSKPHTGSNDDYDNDADFEKEEDTDIPFSQTSQTDQHIRQLDQDGELDEIAGSQSMLSQELLYHSNSRGSNDDNHDAEDDANDQQKKKSKGGEKDVGLGDLQLPQQKKASPIGMARSIGLIHDQEEKKQGKGPKKKMPPKSAAAAKKSSSATLNPSTPKNPRSGTSLLNRTNDAAPSFSATKELIAAENKPKVDITDTPVRESEGFGSLLDAVAKITEQEDSNVTEESILWKRSAAKTLSAAKGKPSSYAALPTKPAERKSKASTTSIRRKKKPLTKRGSMGGGSKEEEPPTRTSPRKRPPMASTSSASASSPQEESPPKKRKVVEKKKKDDGGKKKVLEENKEAEAIAKRAADLAQRTFTDPVLAKRLLLSMALKRENPRSGPESLPGPGHVIPDGFVWAKYPPLENSKSSTTKSPTGN